MKSRKYAQDSMMAERRKVFAPEVETDFDVVPDKEIETWREKLAERFGIGSGKLKVLSEPQAS